jgi:hypothetical protein
MAIVGLSFDKITAVRKEGAKGKINISNNVTVKDVVESNLNLGSQSQDGLKFIFEYTSKYEPDFGDIVLQGTLVFIEDPKRIKEIHAGWKKDKKLPNDVMRETLNAVLNKCNVQALILSREINLPPPIPMPKVNVK